MVVWRPLFNITSWPALYYGINSLASFGQLPSPPQLSYSLVLGLLPTLYSNQCFS